MKTTLGPSPGSVKYPKHRVRIREADGHYTVDVNGKRVADSRNALLLDETGYDGVVYFPPQDVDQTQLLPSDSRTTCPFKGEAKYFAAMVDGQVTDVAWSYPAVYDQVASIEGFIAFYADRVALLAN